ncbi:MAG: hypothetical protein KAI73_03670 [Rhodospirillaceae bacterium]|nr:hypothetical protein [Rhodospirillaceae bacterium]
MMALAAILICAIELSLAHLLNLSSEQYFTVWQIELVLLAIVGLESSGSQRDQSVLAIFLLWFGWIAATDWAIDYAEPLLVQYEAAIFSSLILWALARPYLYPSAELVGENVFIGFYQGTHAPFLSSLGALIGLPFSSIVIASGTIVLRSSKFGKLVTNNIAVVDNGNYVFVDTGVKATPEIFATMAKCSGQPTKAFGIFRTNCVKGCGPVLELLGLKPKNWAYYLPSIFYYQAVRGA